jgi:nicotinate-nucleotide adenylyltransferase
VSRASQAKASRLKAVALYGGSFDPIHSGHVAVAEEALRRFHLDRVIFVPSGIPPHKNRHLAAFSHRFAMIALACANNPRLAISLGEAGEDELGHEVKYSVDTVQSFRRSLKPRATKLYFVTGADQFLGISTWRNAEKLLGLCDFIVANRPGFDLEQLRSAIPPAALASTKEPAHAGGPKHIALRRTSVYPLESVAWDVSATEIRRRVRDHQSISGLVPQAVEDYIRKQGLYQ